MPTIALVNAYVLPSPKSGTGKKKIKHISKRISFRFFVTNLAGQPRKAQDSWKAVARFDVVITNRTVHRYPELVLFVSTLLVQRA